MLNIDGEIKYQLSDKLVSRFMAEEINAVVRSRISKQADKIISLMFKDRDNTTVNDFNDMVKYESSKRASFFMNDNNIKPIILHKVTKEIDGITSTHIKSLIEKHVSDEVNYMVKREVEKHIKYINDSILDIINNNKMFECGKCKREFRSQRGLSMHLNKCDVVPSEESLPTEKKAEEANEAIKTHNSRIEDEMEGISDNIRRRIEKLRDAYKSTYDAEARHNIDCEIRDLKISCQSN